MRRPIILFSLLLLTVGCAGTHVPDGPDVVFIVPGVGGPRGYDALIRSLERPGRSIQMVPWGAPAAFFFLNFSDKSIHDQAEKALAERINQWRVDHPDGTIDLIGHSAGAGVVLGALGQLEQTRVRTIILLAPSISPGYDLRPAIARADPPIHVFISDRDSLLEWRTRTFATYDRIATPAAGVGGFSGAYTDDEVVHHPFIDSWNALGNNGGHWGTLAERFCEEQLAPLLNNPAHHK
jgi:pimeloyl-ACP methyl ester carboxylesterase